MNIALLSNVWLLVSVLKNTDLAVCSNKRNQRLYVYSSSECLTSLKNLCKVDHICTFKSS